MRSDIIDKFKIDGKEVVFRYPKKTDAKLMLAYINKAVDESIQAGGRIGRIKKFNLEDEERWLKDLLNRVKKKESVQLVAESGNKIIGSAGIGIESADVNRHVGVFGIVILEEFTGHGIGTKLSNYIINLAKINLKTELVKLSCFSSNKRAENFYKKLGFQSLGIIRNGLKFRNKYFNDILMVKYL